MFRNKENIRETYNANQRKQQTKSYIFKLDNPAF